MEIKLGHIVLEVHSEDLDQAVADIADLRTAVQSLQEQGERIMADIQTSAADVAQLRTQLTDYLARNQALIDQLQKAHGLSAQDQAAVDQLDDNAKAMIATLQPPTPAAT